MQACTVLHIHAIFNCWNAVTFWRTIFKLLCLGFQPWSTLTSMLFLTELIQSHHSKFWTLPAIPGNHSKVGCNKPLKVVNFVIKGHIRICSLGLTCCALKMTLHFLYFFFFKVTCIGRVNNTSWVLHCNILCLFKKNQVIFFFRYRNSTAKF